MVIDPRMSPSIQDLQDAILTGLIEPAFQPLVDLDANVTIGFEVLARWRHPTLGAINPAVFIRLAEDNALINALTAQVMEKACRRLAQLGPEPILAFNLSPVQFRDETIVDLVVDAIATHGIASHRVHIELTESALLEDGELALQIARKFKERGFGLALDDFGTGFSSLTRLHALPFDKLKIDASFVRRMENDPASRKIVASVIDLGHSLGLAVVAEGVETAEQLDLLKRLGCDIGQGFYLGRPSVSAPGVVCGYPLGSLRSLKINPSKRQKLFQLEAIYRNSPNALAFIDCDAVIIHANERFSDILRRPLIELKGMSATSCLESTPRKRIERILGWLLKGNSINQLEVSDEVAGRTYIASCTRVVDDEGELMGLSVALLDVTRRKRAENLLRADEEHFRSAAGGGLHIVWAARPTGEVYYMGPTLSSGRGVVVEDRIADWYGRMQPDDRDRVRQEWLEWLPTGRPFVTHFRILGLDGDWHHVTSSAKPRRNCHGAIDHWLGIISE